MFFWLRAKTGVVGQMAKFLNGQIAKLKMGAGVGVERRGHHCVQGFGGAGAGVGWWFIGVGAARRPHRFAVHRAR